MELKLECLDDNMSKDTYVSVRIGEVQKLSRISAGRTFKFPQSAIGERKFGKVEIFNRVGGASVGIIPAENDQEVAVPIGDRGSVKFRVMLDSKEKPPPAKIEGDKPKPKDLNPKVLAAKEYLEKHNLELRLSEAMQAVLREKPEDPAAFVADKLMKSAGALVKVPKAAPAPEPEPKAETPAPAPEKKEEAQVCTKGPIEETAAPAAPTPAAEPAPTPAAAPAAEPVPPGPVDMLPFSKYYSKYYTSVPSADMACIYAMFGAKKSVAQEEAKAPVATEPAKPAAEEEAKAPAAKEPAKAVAEADASAMYAWTSKPSVGTWYTKKVKKGVAAAAPAPALATAATPAPAAAAAAAPAQATSTNLLVLPSSGFYGPSFYSCGIRPSIRVMG